MNLVEPGLYVRSSLSYLFVVSILVGCAGLSIVRAAGESAKQVAKITGKPATATTAAASAPTAKELEKLKAQAVSSLNRATEDFLAWVELVRDPKKPWAFRWAKDSVHEGNVVATVLVLGTADRLGVMDRILTRKQKRQGSEWIRSLEEEKNTFSDPVLLKHNSQPGIKESINQNARACLYYYEGTRRDSLAGPHEIGYSISKNGMDWPLETRLTAQTGDNQWAGKGDHDMRTPLCAIREDDGTFTVIYTAKMKDKGFWGVGKCTLGWEQGAVRCQK